MQRRKPTSLTVLFSNVYRWLVLHAFRSRALRIYRGPFVDVLLLLLLLLPWKRTRQRPAVLTGTRQRARSEGLLLTHIGTCPAHYVTPRWRHLSDGAFARGPGCARPSYEGLSAALEGCPCRGFEVVVGVGRPARGPATCRPAAADWRINHKDPSGSPRTRTVVFNDNDIYHNVLYHFQRKLIQMIICAPLLFT